MKNKSFVLPFIVLSQFMCTSMWFAGNAVIPQLEKFLQLSTSDIGWMTSSVQFGFIVGTMVYAILTIADRHDPSRVFLVSALIGALFNFLITIEGLGFSAILLFRFCTGFFLAGIYPVGMKIASDHFEKGLGKALSFLVGALVLGSAFPLFIASLKFSFDWKIVLYTTSSLTILGGFFIVIFVGEGPYRKKGQQLKFEEMRHAFRHKTFRSAVFGYFGHMWELYAFWTFVPVVLGFYASDLLPQQISSWSFLVIGLGALACFVGGFLAERFGVKRMAKMFLTLSGLCCLVSPIIFELSFLPFIVFLVFWGLVVIADSPLFSTLVAQNADPKIKGTALTLVNSIGFAITIVSIQLLSYLVLAMNNQFIFMILAVGPAFGVLSLRRD